MTKKIVFVVVSKEEAAEEKEVKVSLASKLTASFTAQYPPAA